MTKSFSTKTLKFKYKSGTTATGKDKFSYNTISKVDSELTDEVIFGLLALVSSVQEVASAEMLVDQTVTFK